MTANHSGTATFVLIPGAGGAGRVYWRRVVERLRALGHTAVAVDFPAGDPACGLPEYAALTDAAVVDAATDGDRGVVLVAQSMGGFTAPMVHRSDRIGRIVLLNAMIPMPGETPGEWWDAVGQPEAFTAAARAAGRPTTFDLETVFLHDLPDDARADLGEGSSASADTPFEQPAAFARWPDVPVHVLVGADDRMFPVAFQQRVARDRLGVEADVMPGGHLVAMSRPAEVADRLVAYAESGGADCPRRSG